MLSDAIFGALVTARNLGYRRGWLPSYELESPVISVGNIAVGGSGKTPTVIALGQALSRLGWRCDVLTRGYRRKSRQMAVIADGHVPELSGGKRFSAADAAVSATGDEPLLIARALACPVLVNADRVRAGEFAERLLGTDRRVHLLDDGFQHRRLRRQFDLVLVDPSDLNGSLLPRGRLRERPAALDRAHAVLWLGSGSGELAAARAALASLSGAPVFVAHKEPGTWARVARRPLAFCGLARPQSFLDTLRECGVEPAELVAWRDHKAYGARELQFLQKRAKHSGADGWITTEKDWVNIAGGVGEQRAREMLPGIEVVPIRMAIAGEAELLDLIAKQLERRPSP